MTSPSSVPSTPGSDRDQAYRAGARMAKERISREAPPDAAALDALEASDIVVVTGVYDRVQQVLGALEMPFTAVSPDHLPEIRLRPEQLLVLNCPGDVGPRGVGLVRSFVESGGSLFSTDWALERVLEPAFPNTVRFNRHATADDVVPIEILDDENPFLQGVMDGADEPQWWLEGSSHPIEVLDRSRVQVLITSRELGRRYGEPAVAVLFPWGEGEVFHMISHYYLQRTELRSERQRLGASAYFEEKGMAAPGGLGSLSVGDVESAATSSRLIANVVAAKKRAAAQAKRAERERGGKETDR
jgi:hypothetical protein